MWPRVVRWGMSSKEFACFSLLSHGSAVLTTDKLAGRHLPCFCLWFTQAINFNEFLGVFWLIFHLQKTRRAMIEPWLSSYRSLDARLSMWSENRLSWFSFLLIAPKRRRRVPFPHSPFFYVSNFTPRAACILQGPTFHKHAFDFSPTSRGPNRRTAF